MPTMQRQYTQPQYAQPQNTRPDHGRPHGTGIAGGPDGPRLSLALFGLPPDLAEPVAMVADILGWTVAVLPPGPVMSPRADLCLAMLPTDAGTQLPPIAVWSPNKNLNEHIFQSGLSILEQPPCIQHLEQLLQIIAELR